MIHKKNNGDFDDDDFDEETGGDNEPPVDRRRYSRIDDTISVELRTINRKNLTKELELFEDRREKFCMLNDVGYQKEQHLAERRILEKKHPDIARYLAHLESRIDLLSKVLLTDDNHGFGHKLRVNISAQGMQFLSRKAYNEDDLLEFRIVLHPHGQRLLIIGTVIWCMDDPDAPVDEQYAIAVDFTYINDADREALDRHIQTSQLRRVRELEAEIPGEDEHPEDLDD